MDFSEFLSVGGVDDSEGLTQFVTAFLNDPSIFFDLSEKDRAKLEKQMDAALSISHGTISFEPEKTSKAMKRKNNERMQDLRPATSRILP